MNDGLEGGFPNGRDCEHGNQRGKCDSCELAELHEQIGAGTNQRRLFGKGNKMYPPFTMSKYATKEQLYKDKASYYEQLAKTLAANADNDKLSDADFRQVVRNSIPEFKAANAELRGASPLAGAASLSNAVLERTADKEQA